MPSKPDIWMPLYIGDILADTSHLDAQRFGCYMLWLMHYWRKGPLDAEISDLIAIGKLRGKDAPSIAQAMLKEFFTKNGDGRWHQKRADIEIAKWQDKSLVAKEKAKKAAEGRWKKKDAPSIPQAMLEPCPPPSPSPKEQIQEQIPSPKPRKKPRVSEDGMKHSGDPRHIACKEVIFAYYRARNDNADPEWDGREGGALGKLLSANPELTAAELRRFLGNRYLSEVNHAERPSVWISIVAKYRNSPLDRYGQPITKSLNGTNGTKPITMDDMKYVNAEEVNR